MSEMALPTNLLEWTQTLAYIVAAIAGFASFIQYFVNSRRNRAQWIFELYDRFYTKPELKNMRMLIDKGEEGTKFIEENNEQKLTELDDFLNFFVFIAYLMKSCQLKKKEIRAMFGYTLKRISNNRNLLEYMNTYGYENLTKMLEELNK